MFPKKSKDPSPLGSFDSGASNFQLPQDSRHPTYPKQPVKFPLQEVNSIHNRDYRERLPYSLDDG